MPDIRKQDIRDREKREKEEALKLQEALRLGAAPEGFRKIAQQDTMAGVVQAAVFYNQISREYYVQTRKGDDFIGMIIPEISFFALSNVMSDVETMKRKYIYLD